MHKQITLKDLYIELKSLERALRKKGVISEIELPEGNNELILDWPADIQALSDEKLLEEDWLSPEDEEAWKDL